MPTGHGEIIIAGLSPHPPIVMPQVGRGEEAKIASTSRALTKLGEAFAAAHAETLVVITPHGPVFSDAVAIRSQSTLRGSLSNFGAPGVKVEYPNDIELVQAIEEEALRDPGIPVVLMDDRKLAYYNEDKALDHGAVIPLHFISKAGFSGKLVVVNIAFISAFDLYRFGAAIERAIAGTGRKVVLLGSGDLSHRLIPGSPNGYSPRGKEFDAKILDIVERFEPVEVVTFPSDLEEEAGECGFRPIAMMMGALDRYRVTSERLSYEGPFGVGYGVMLLRPSPGGDGFSRMDAVRDARYGKIMAVRSGESTQVSLARATVEAFVKSGGRRIPPAPVDVPPEMQRPAGVFVSIHKEGTLRGCIGTTEATEDRVADEIVANAVSAASRDPRFRPIGEDELDLLDYSVDVLSDSEPVSSEAELDPKVYGVIVERGGRRGLLLPDLPGVDTVEEQVRIAKQKAGIRASEGVTLRRFTVTRYR